MDKDVLDYIRKLRKQGNEIEQIKKSLVDAGHNEESAEEHIRHILKQEKTSSIALEFNAGKTNKGRKIKEITKKFSYKHLILAVVFIWILLVIVLSFRSMYERYGHDVEDNIEEEVATAEITEDKEKQSTVEQMPGNRDQEINKEIKLNKSKEIIGIHKESLESSSDSIEKHMPDNYLATFSLRMSKLTNDVNAFSKQPDAETKEFLLNEIRDFRKELKEQFTNIGRTKDAQQRMTEFLNSLTSLESSIIETEV